MKKIKGNLNGISGIKTGMNIDPDKVADFIRQVAEERISPRFQKLQASEINTKSGPNDLVTIADLEAEVDLTRLLSGLIPGSLVVGEEAVSQGKVDINCLYQMDTPIWVIDPVDGTHNFATGKPVFATIISLVQGGITRAGWIYDIPGNRMCMTQQGGGTYMHGNRLQMRESPDNTSMHVLQGFISTQFVPREIKPQVQEKVSAFAKTDTWMCCAHEYLSLCQGERDFSFYSRIKPWDHLAGALMVAESGGYARKWDGTAYVPGEQVGGLINAASPALYHAIRNHLMP
jgi:fructose-1,6-bisphosphatase/inositol monophosphatase family enzyme